MYNTRHLHYLCGYPIMTQLHYMTNMSPPTYSSYAMVLMGFVVCHVATSTLFFTNISNSRIFFILIQLYKISKFREFLPCYGA